MFEFLRLKLSPKRVLDNDYSGATVDGGNLAPPT